MEQALFQTLQTWRSLDPVKRRLYYWRNPKGDEVDFILENHGKLVALEVKSASSPGLQDAAGLQAFRKALGKKGSLVRSVVLYGGSEMRLLDQDCHALPWGWMFP